MAINVLQQTVMYCMLAIVGFVIILPSSYALPTESVERSEAAQLDERQTDYPGYRGLHVIPGKCQGQDLKAVKYAIAEAGLLANAALNAAANFNKLPFSYFFKDDVITANTVATVFQRIKTSAQGPGATIGVTCEDLLKHCKPGSATYAVEQAGSGIAPVIVFCPIGLQMKRSPLVPCKAPPGTISLGWLMIASMTHLSPISGRGRKITDAELESARHVQQLLSQGKDTTLISSAYAHLGGWSNDLGLANPDTKSCLSTFWHGNFDQLGSDVVDMTTGIAG